MPWKRIYMHSYIIECGLGVFVSKYIGTYLILES